MRRLVQISIALLALALAGAPAAAARGGDYAFEGGTRAQRAQVRAALEASAFDWGLVPARVTIHIRDGELSRSTPGHIWLDARLLDAGVFSWGIVQHEYAHQVAFFLLDDPARAWLTSLLGARDWCYEREGLAHGEHGCERFASTLAWAYWPVRQNSQRPTGPDDESAALPADRFRDVLAGILAAPRLAAAPEALRTTQARRR